MAIGEFGEDLVEVNWLPFLLDSGVAPGGENFQAYTYRRWGGDGWTYPLRRLGATVGAHFRQWTWWPEALPAMRLLQLCTSRGISRHQAQNEIFNAIFEEGENASDALVLAHLAERRLGIDAAEVRQYLESGGGTQEIVAEASDALRRYGGVSSVPHFIVSTDSSSLAASAWLLQSACQLAFTGVRQQQRAAGLTAAQARVTTVDEAGRFRFIAGDSPKRVTTVDSSGRFRFITEAAAAPAPPTPAPAPPAPAPAPPAPAPAPPAPAPPPKPAGPVQYEIFVTQPTVGERTRMQVTADTTVDFVITEARKILGFDAPFIPDSNFKIYLKGDEMKEDGAPITGKLGEHGLRPWGPDGFELHLMFEPAE